MIVCASHERRLDKLKETSIPEDFATARALPNVALQEFLENDSFYREKLLHLTNRGNKYRFDKCLEAVRIIMAKDSHYFNQNDMNLLVDITLREI